jgi:hypothetical protein
VPAVIQAAHRLAGLALDLSDALLRTMLEAEGGAPLGVLPAEFSPVFDFP